MSTLIAVLMALMVVGACAAPTTRSKATPVPPPPAWGPAPAAVVVAMDLPTGGIGVERRAFSPERKAERLFDVEPGVAVGALGERFQTITDDLPDIGGGHFDAAPRLRILRTDGSVVADLGRGGPAAISPDRRTLAWLAPLTERTCDEHDDDECSIPDADLVVATVDDPQERRTVDRFEDPAGVAWVGPDELVVLGPRHQATLTTLDGDGRRLPLGGDPIAFGSGRIAVTSDGSGLRVIGTDGPTMVERSFAPARVNASFAPGGRTLLVQTVTAHSDGLADGGIVVLDTAAGRHRAVPETRANGELLWTQDGAWLGYRREADVGFEFVMCRADGHSCRPALTWTDGIQLLAFDESPDGKGDR